MKHIIKCLGLQCPWRKECIRFEEGKDIKTQEAMFITPWSTDGCQYFLTDELRRETIDAGRIINKNDRK